MWDKWRPVSELLYHAGTRASQEFHLASYRTYLHTTHSSIMSFLRMVPFLSHPDITQVNLACIPKASLSPCMCTDPVNSCPEWQSSQHYLVLPANLIHNIITLTWPCHASYRRWMSPNQGQPGNGPHPDFKTGRNHLSSSICLLQARKSEGVPSQEAMCSKQIKL